MARIATRFYGPALLTAAPVTIYTVPANSKAIIRHIHAVNLSGGTASVLTMSIGVDATGTRIFSTNQVPAGSFLDNFGYYVLEAGEIIQAYSSAINLIILTVDGDLSILS
jgi:hypothetical protein